jgi:predicted RNA-binding protein with PUA-like domain
MNYWLVKSEPNEYSYQDLVDEGRAIWDGVRNYAARNHLRGMQVGDLVLFYHSVKQKAVVGICKVVKEAYPDPTAEKGDWSAVDLVPVKEFSRPVHLREVKTVPELQEIPLVRIGRLSVMPLENDAFFKLLELGETSL